MVSIAGAFGVSVVGSLIGGTLFVRYFRHRVASSLREYIADLHQAKNKTPTMGGLFFLVAAVAALVVCGPWTDIRLWVMLGALLGFGAIGFWDDWAKLVHGKGISERQKFGAQVAVSALAMLVWYVVGHPSTALGIPPFIPLHLDLGMLFIPWGMWLLLSCTNAVNLTDGLDGLAGSLFVLNAGTFGLIACFQGDLSVALMAAALAGAVSGFLWFNVHPAAVFMGDVGALALGAGLGLLALMTKQELILPITGALFVIEVLSVMVQVAYFKRTGKRLFKTAPLHHHFERSGVAETAIVGRFTLITLWLCSVVLFLYRMV